MLETPVQLMIICVSCEEHIGDGERAIRYRDSLGRCTTCGSESVMKLPPRQENRRRQWREAS